MSDGGATQRRCAQRSKGQGGVRECVPGNGNRPRPWRKTFDAGARRHRHGNRGALHGGMVVARSLKDGRFSDRLRDAATHAALVLGGWKRDTTTLPNTSPSENSPAVLKRPRKDLRRTTTRVKR